MDCEKYEPLLLDELYEELDELTSAAVKRHVSGCARCAAILQGMRATRRAAVLPMVDPPADLEERILAAAREAQKVVPLRGRVSQLVSRAGNWAMRPQTAMAAVFLLMIGSSAFLIRSNRSTSQSAVSVTVAGEPSPVPAASIAAASGDTLSGPAAAAAHGPGAPPMPLAVPTASPTPPADLFGAERKKKDEAPAYAFGGQAEALGAARSADDAPQAGGQDALSAGQAAYRARNFAEATKQFDSASSTGNLDAALWAAKSTRDGSGCGVALGRFDALAQRAQGTWHGAEAQLEAARCELALGQLEPARDRLRKLSAVASHSTAAQRELEQADQIAARRSGTGTAGGAAGGGVAASKAAAPAAPRAVAPAARPAAQAAPLPAPPATTAPAKSTDGL